MKKWRKISTKRVFSHPKLTLWEDEVELPSGLKTSYIHFGKPRHSATIIAINDVGKLLVQQEYSYPPDEWLYQFPGGGIEDGESPINGARRELEEEAGYTGDLEQIGWYYRDNRRSAGKMFVYTATNLKSVSASQDDVEEFVSHWMTEEEISSLIKRGEFTNYSAIAAWGFYLNQSE